MRSTTKALSVRLKAFLPSLLLLYGVASLTHFTHNAEFLTDYPNLPEWLTRSQVYLAWLCLTALGLLGYLLFRSKYQGVGFCLLAGYAVLGLDGLAHYTRAPLTAHTATMNFTIWFEVIAAALVLVALVAVRRGTSAFRFTAPYCGWRDIYANRGRIFMDEQFDRGQKEQHAIVKQKYDEVQSDGRYEEGMARMAIYHRYCQDPVIFRALGDVRGKSLLDLACGEGFYTRRFRAECGAVPVIGVDLSPKQIARAQAIEQHEPLGIEYRVGDVTKLELSRRFDVATAIHLLHYLENAAEIQSTLRGIYNLLDDDGYFVTMIANPEFDLQMHDASDSKAKFGYYFSKAESGNGALLRFHPGGFEKERELTIELRRWERGFIDGIAAEVGFTAKWHDPFITAEGLQAYGASFFENYLANPQSKLLRLTKRV